MALKIQGQTVIDDDRGLSDISQIGIGTTANPTGAKLLVDVGSGTTAVTVQGSEGQLFSVTNELTTGSIFSVNDVSGIPSIDVDADGTILVAPYSTTEKVGFGTTSPAYKMDVVGDINFTGTLFQNGTEYTSGIASLTNDTSPVLGADLDANSNNIFGVNNLNITGVSTFQGNVKLLDSDTLSFGAGEDFKIGHYFGTNSITMINGNLSFVDSSSNERLKLTNNGDWEIKDNQATTRLKVIGTGATVTGDLYATTLYGDGSNLTGVQVTPQGTDTAIQFNDNSSFSGIASLASISTSTFSVGIGTIIDIKPYDTQNSGTLSFEASAGQLFSITNNLTSGSIFSVNDVSGIPSIDVDADGTVLVAPYSTTEKVGIGTTNPQYKFHVVGNTNIDGTFTVNGSAVSGGGGALEAFKTISVSGQSDVVADSATDTLTLVAGNNMTITTNAGSDSITFAASGGGGSGVASTITVADESSDTTCFPVFSTAATGDVNPKTGSNLTFNSSNGTLTATEFSGGGAGITGVAKLSGQQFYSSGDLRFADDGGIYLGTGYDMYILHLSSGGNLIRGVNQNLTIDTAISGDILIKPIGSVELYENGSKKFETTGSGAIVTGVLTATSLDPVSVTIKNSRFLYLGNSNEGSITYDAANLEIATSSGDLNLKGSGSVALYEASSKKLETTGAGVTVTGDLIVSNNARITGILTVGGTITELYNGSYWNVVTQADVGYGASQVPLNQYLGQLAFLDDYHPNGLRRDGGGSDDVFVNSSGDVGIGTTNPTSKLTVEGNARITGILTVGSSSITLNGTDNSIHGFDALIAPPKRADTINISVTVGSKTTANRYYDQGSSNCYFLNGIEAPFLTLTPGRTYRFTLSSSDMTNHPFRLYLEADKTTAYTTNVTSTATYTEIVVNDTTPSVLHYQCSVHSLMGNSVQLNSNKVDTPYRIDGLNGANITGVVTATSFVKSSNSSGFLKADGTEDTNTYLTSLGTAILDGDFTSNGFMKRTGQGTYAVDSNTYLTSYTETDPVVGAINGIVKANGSGTISAATSGTDYLTPSGDGSSLTNLTGASAATYGSSTATPVIVVDANGRITGISTVATSGSGGGGGDTVSITSTAADILSVSSGAISGDDAGADKIVFWDDSAGKLTYLTVGTNLSISGTTISASGGSGSSTTRSVNRYVATNNQTLFPPSGTVSYTVGYIDVYLNGSKLDSTEFTASNGTTITLTTGASANDIVELIAYTNINVTDVTVVNDTTPQLGGDLDLNGNDITGSGNISINGNQVATQNDAIAFAIALG